MVQQRKGLRLHRGRRRRPDVFVHYSAISPPATVRWTRVSVSSSTRPRVRRVRRRTGFAPSERQPDRLTTQRAPVQDRRSFVLFRAVRGPGSGPRNSCRRQSQRPRARRLKSPALWNDCSPRPSPRVRNSAGSDPDVSLRLPPPEDPPRWAGRWPDPPRPSGRRREPPESVRRYPGSGWRRPRPAARPEKRRSPAASCCRTGWAMLSTTVVIGRIPAARVSARTSETWSSVIKVTTVPARRRGRYGRSGGRTPCARPADRRARRASTSSTWMPRAAMSVATSVLA